METTELAVIALGTLWAVIALLIACMAFIAASLVGLVGGSVHLFRDLVGWLRSVGAPQPRPIG